MAMLQPHLIYHLPEPRGPCHKDGHIPHSKGSHVVFQNEECIAQKEKFLMIPGFLGLNFVRSQRQRIVAIALIFVAACLPLLMGRGNAMATYNLSQINILHGQNDGYNFCHTKGSLHQLALDMFNYKSPPGSPSYNKLKRVLSLNSHFSIDMGGTNAIFSKNEEMMARMLRGMGLRQVPRTIRNPLDYQNVTLVDTWFTRSTCPLMKESCKNHPRIYIQTEQRLSTNRLDIPSWDYITACHESPNCVIFEFSDYNLEKAKQEKGDDVLDSFVLLPVMTQVPSRVSHYEPAHHKILQNRSIDIVFFGSSLRRNDWIAGADAYLKSYPNFKVLMTQSFDVHYVAKSYSEAKVCLMVHSYNSISGGEYHRLSEFSQFGCIPVVESFADTLGIQSYEKCGGVIFTNLTNVVPMAIDVVQKIDEGFYSSTDSDRAHDIINWWKAGIQWEGILPTIFGAEWN